MNVQTASLHTFIFYIRSEPAQNEHVVVDVNVIGRCTHSASTEHQTPVTHRRGRRLHGARRQETARVLVTCATMPTKQYYEQLTHMLSAALASGNVTECKSPEVYREAASKLSGGISSEAAATSRHNFGTTDAKKELDGVGTCWRS